MTYEQIRNLIERKDDTYPVPKLPPADEKDFIVWGEGEYERAVKEWEELEKRAIQKS